MRWAVIYRDRSHGRITVARDGDCREACLRAAAVLEAIGHQVHALVSPDGQVTPRETIQDFCRGSRTKELAGSES